MLRDQNINFKKYLFLYVFCLFGSQLAIADDTLRSGMKASEVIAIKGQPYYQTEHLAHKKGDEIWLYTKNKEDKSVDEKRIIDQQTNWPTLYRKTTTKSCAIGDVFVEMSHGVVKSIIAAKNSMAYGPCVISVLEEFLPLVDGKPAATPQRTIQNSTLEK